MDIDPLDIAKPDDDEPSDGGSRHHKHPWLNPAVGVAVALLATFMGICKVKDDNIVQGMQQAQADKIDHWAFYQARNLREEVAKATAVQLRLQAADRAPDKQPAWQDAITHYEQLAKDQADKKEELRRQAAKDQENYDALNYRDDQFDLSDALIAIAISLLAITSLTQLRWLYAISMLPAFSGVLMGLAGLLGWAFHPTALVKLLS